MVSVVCVCLLHVPCLHKEHNRCVSKDGHCDKLWGNGQLHVDGGLANRREREARVYWSE